jgi:glycosyltransferase involved in cell wall biosynthesis
LSVVTPIYNGESFAKLFLRSLSSQETDEPVELIVVDDGSTDNSISRSLQALADPRMKMHLLLLRRKRTTPYRRGTFTFSAGLAREIGWRQSQGERVLFLDPDQIVEPGCLQEHIDWGRRGRDVIIGDRRADKPDVTTSWSRLRQEALSDQRDWWLSFFTGNASVARSALADAGGFDRTFQYWGLDDTDLAYRLFQLGSSVWHTPRAVVTDLAPECSGGGSTADERRESYRLHMEVLYRKYLDAEILDAFRFAWPESLK